MKVVSLCPCCEVNCPVVKIFDEYVEVSEGKNVCILKKEEWEILRQKILEGERSNFPIPQGGCD